MANKPAKSATSKPGAKPARRAKSSSTTDPKKASVKPEGVWVKSYNAKGKAKMVWRPNESK